MRDEPVSRKAGEEERTTRRRGMHRPSLTPAARARRKRLLTATLITCIAVAMIGGSLHVMDLGSLRLQQMRAKAGYDPAEMHKHIRAAGEEIYRQLEHEKKGGNVATYSEAEAQALLAPEEWRELDATILIPAGVFIMGSDSPRTNPENRPAHKVRLPAYRIDKYPVTMAQYARFVAAMRYRPPLNWEHGRIPRGMLKHPVTMISWYNARDYCAWAGKRLPREAEWEKAARGTDGRTWPWGNRMDPSRLNTYYKERHTTPVDQFPQGASPYGVMDMAGNVQEWTADIFAPYPGTDAPDEVFEPKLLDPNYQRGSDEQERLEYRVMRGGSWKSDPFSTTTYHRNYSLPNYASDFFGFRCVTPLTADEARKAGAAGAAAEKKG